MNSVLKIVLTSLWFIPGYSMISAQPKPPVDILYKDCQQCLDSTGYTEMCNRTLYNRLDSLLNATYQNFKATLSGDDKNKLIKEENLWLKQRDVYFKKIKKETDEHNPPGTEIANTIILDKENDFIRRRIIELVDRP